MSCLLLSLSQMENTGYELERLYSDVTSLCSRIELLPCSTARDRLAQSGKNILASDWPRGLHSGIWEEAAKDEWHR